jgi:hypothetical protein
VCVCPPPLCFVRCFCNIHTLLTPSSIFTLSHIFITCMNTHKQVGPAWFDEAWADNKAHRPVECSSQGTCDRSTGTCQCSKGFYGSACQFQKCVPQTDVPCNGHGRCKSIRDLALDSRYNGDLTPYEYGASTAPVVGENMDNNTMDVVWDADVVHGCACDSTGNKTVIYIYKYI